jgi:hypothetical protein
MNVTRTKWPIFLLFTVWIIFSAPFLFRNKIPFPSKYLVTAFPPWSAEYTGPVKNAAMPDVITQIYPWKKLTIDTWKSGQIPLWNPYSFSGTVHAANYQSAVFSPINALFFVLPFDIAWGWMILLQPLLAGVFMYAYLSQLHLDRRAKYIGSIAFMFCGFGVVWMAYGTLFYAALFLPLALAFIERDVQKHHWIWGPLLSVSIFLSFVSGHFQISLYVLIFSIAYCLYFGSNWRNKIRLFMFIVLGVGLSSPQLLLSFEAYRESARSSSFQSGEIIPWQYILTLLMPDAYGNPVTRNDWFGHYAEWAGYIGIIPFVLAIRSVFSKYQPVQKFFLFSAVFALLMAYQGPLTSLLFWLRIPALSTSAASRIIVLFSFSLSVLSAFGFSLLLKDWKSGKSRDFLKMISFVVIFFTVVVLIAYVIKPVNPDRLLILKRNILLPIVINSVAMLLMFGGFIRKYRGKMVLFCSGGLLLLTSLDSVRFASKWMPFDDPDLLYPCILRRA